MRSFLIKNNKTFTQALFAETTFDQFLMCEASFMTNQTYTIDGRVLAEYYDSEEDRGTDAFTRWVQNRPICYQMIKGRRLPLYFKIVFSMSRSATEKIISRSGCSETIDDIDGLYLNVYFKEGAITCTTGISQKTFTMDKTLSNYWDKQIEGFLTRSNMDFE